MVPCHGRPRDTWTLERAGVAATSAALTTLVGHVRQEAKPSSVPTRGDPGGVPADAASSEAVPPGVPARAVSGETGVVFTKQGNRLHNMG